MSKFHLRFYNLAAFSRRGKVQHNNIDKWLSIIRGSYQNKIQQERTDTKIGH